MSTIDIERVIWDLHRKGRAGEFASAPDDVLAQYPLGADERKALLERDYRRLYQMGVHPMAVLFFSQVNKTPMPMYLEAIGSPPERVEQFKRLMGRP